MFTPSCPQCGDVDRFRTQRGIVEVCFYAAGLAVVVGLGWWIVSPFVRWLH